MEIGGPAETVSAMPPYRYGGSAGGHFRWMFELIARVLAVRQLLPRRFCWMKQWAIFFSDVCRIGPSNSLARGAEVRRSTIRSMLAVNLRPEFPRRRLQRRISRSDLSFAKLNLHSESGYPGHTVVECHGWMPLVVYH